MVGMKQLRFWIEWEFILVLSVTRTNICQLMQWGVKYSIRAGSDFLYLYAERFGVHLATADNFRHRFKRCTNLHLVMVFRYTHLIVVDALNSRYRYWNVVRWEIFCLCQNRTINLTFYHDEKLQFICSY